MYLLPTRCISVFRMDVFILATERVYSAILTESFIAIQFNFRHNDFNGQAHCIRSAKTGRMTQLQSDLGLVFKGLIVEDMKSAS
jgi:hypothetical protein